MLGRENFMLVYLMMLIEHPVFRILIICCVADGKQRQKEDKFDHYYLWICRVNKPRSWAFSRFFVLFRRWRLMTVIKWKFPDDRSTSRSHVVKLIWGSVCQIRILIRSSFDEFEKLKRTRTYMRRFRLAQRSAVPDDNESFWSNWAIMIIDCFYFLLFENFWVILRFWYSADREWMRIKIFEKKILKRVGPQKNRGGP